MGILTTKHGLPRKWDIRNLLAAFWSLFGATYISLITFGHIPKDNVRFADTILGFLLGTLITTLMNWYFGGAKDKENAS